MKKLLIFILAIILAIIALANLGSIIGFAICLLIVYYSLKQFLKTESTGQKILWGIIGLIGLSGLLGNLPALVGIAAVCLLYVGYKHWKKEKAEDVHQEDDPFTNFESQWNELEKSLNSKGD
ncbi:DUF2681 domain-containing protein [Lederbergia sp. NSJ-179]|uniref:lmo0954 family membrane protein n=1 Tax=Lederbergia sp. NSJ-179 TaxID=2931402 RepID=UPI001FD1ECDF|nr:DUF2681 domain-containing protein [Lederbergia sp. NSJ-179]MCJ7841475.1 DUF2681 domain-containing protein [Lederbergia sp. NSJ-179]